MADHLMAPGETLAEVAEASGASGWQGVYYAEVNQEFRVRHPDPWDIPPGARVLIPSSMREQRVALLARIRTLETLISETTAIGADQLVLLRTDLARTALEDPERQLGPFTRRLASSILGSIRLLKAPESGGDRASLALAGEVLQRSALTTRSECASLLTLLAGAARGVSWVVPQALGRGWCDAASPNFWAKPLVSMVAGWARAEGQALLPVLRRAHEVAYAGVLHQLQSLRTTAMMELNRLARLEEEGGA
ncbi:MAG: hypothetical protein MUC77_08970 [Chromatiaceae bacterium]|jgi:hypothetical protein|nr:hypothetical protein [Chromatiaceae bacterium]